MGRYSMFQNILGSVLSTCTIFCTFAIEFHFSYMGIFNFFSKEKKETLDRGLSKTKEGFWGKLGRVIAGKSKIDDEILDDLEEVFITSEILIFLSFFLYERIPQCRLTRI